MTTGVAHKADFALTLSCEDTVGIVHAVSGFLVKHGCNIVDSAQFGDPDTQRFFMRVAFTSGGAPVDDLRTAFAPIGQRFGMVFEIRDLSVKPRVAIMVSRYGHCLNDLLYRYASGDLRVEIPAIISNHQDFAGLAARSVAEVVFLPVIMASGRLRARIDS